VTRLGDLLARAFAEMVARSSDERLRWLSSGWRRRLVLAAILQQMPRRLDRGRATAAHAVVDWKITGAPGGGIDHFQVRIDDGWCRVIRRPKESARATLELDGADFLRLAAGAAEGGELFMTGKLRIEGDLMFTAQLPSLFRIPAQPRKR
jgi:putative sterol carrier protein